MAKVIIGCILFGIAGMIAIITRIGLINYTLGLIIAMPLTIICLIFIMKGFYDGYE